MHIELPIEAEPRLKELAAAAGFGDDVGRYVLDRFLGDDVDSAAGERSGARLPRDKWKAEFEAFLAALPNRDTRLDDSRASIYAGRGE